MTSIATYVMGRYVSPESATRPESGLGWSARRIRPGSVAKYLGGEPVREPAVVLGVDPRDVLPHCEAPERRLHYYVLDPLPDVQHEPRSSLGHTSSLAFFAVVARRDELAFPTR